MKSKKVFDEFDRHFGTSSPVWQFSSSSDELVLSRAGGEQEPQLSIPLNGEQAASIRYVTGATTVLLLNVRLFGRNVELQLVGKKISEAHWAGVAAALCDAETVARNSMDALAFAEGIISEVNAVVVVLDKEGTIHRFNKMAEEYAGRKEADVIGKNAQRLFMTPDEGESSRRNITRFFERGQPYDVERNVQTVNGSRRFLFRNRFIGAGNSGSAECIVCSGIEIPEVVDSDAVVRTGDRRTALGEAYCLDVLKRVMDWAAMVDGARALLASVEEGSGDAGSLAHAKRLAASAVKDAYGLYEEIDARLTVGPHRGQ
ncbi:PAS domain S-box protein [Paraburkholderia sp. CNPSo 3157]|uniref:PAS domain S-box protein n=1 Tax=Paraburkholderia franconis TaxID=2654983 RepID=A0A7X1NH21_9BURK|nr:PAS domain S-box protein [Paraburkholderia franconis]MPW21744.1 PAS domain S-box protein [Paraburkholderia franconis]